MTSTQLDNGPLPAPRDGHWVKLGMVGVDTGTIAICDPVLAGSTPTVFDGLSAPYGEQDLGVQFLSGWGDGYYDVWGWVANDDCGSASGRVTQVVITMIEEHEMIGAQQE
jgi:hypothetical protein